METVARRRGLYDITGGQQSDALGAAGTADVAWGYERLLPLALEELHSSQALDGLLWVTVVVPFVAGLFVRGPQFQQEFLHRFPAESIEHLPNVDAPNNATAARLIDFQVLLAPLLAARWIVLHFSSGIELVTNDGGFALTSTPLGASPSYVVPIGRQAAVVVTPRTSGSPLLWAGDGWVAELEHVEVPDREAPALNRAMGAFARAEVYGSTRDAVMEGSSELGEVPQMGPSLFAPLDPASHLYDYFRVLCVLRRGPDDAQSRADALDWSTISESDWTGPVVVELLFPERTSGGVRVEEERVIVDLRYGVELRSARRDGDDFRMGALALAELSHLRGLGSTSDIGQH